jgi:lauroyl/myristoyl acyltransferase
MSWYGLARTSRARVVLHSLQRYMEYVHRYVLAPLAAWLPAPLAYRLACMRGDRRFKLDRITRERMLLNLEQVLGDRLTPEERLEVCREHFRLRACETVDILRLIGRGRRLARLVEIRGLEHLKAALAQGHGAMLASAHYGSFEACAALLGIAGLPMTLIRRVPSEHDPLASDLAKHYARHITEPLIRRHLSRPSIEPDKGQFATAALAALVMRRNELVVSFLDPPAWLNDQPRTVACSFLGRTAHLLPGCAAIALSAKAPIFIITLRRSSDYYHQVLEIESAITVPGDIETTFCRCLGTLDQAIQRAPAHWIYWPRTEDLADLGILTRLPLATSPR